MYSKFEYFLDTNLPKNGVSFPGIRIYYIWKAGYDFDYFLSVRTVFQRKFPI